MPVFDLAILPSALLSGSSRGNFAYVAAVILAVALVAALWHLQQPVVIKELWIYPVKSCAGVQLSAARMQRGGLQWDREFAVMKPDGEVLTQKVYAT